MAESAPCLVRTGQCAKGCTILKLKTDQVIIGRSRQATFTLPSLVISRWHAIISHLQGTRWSLMDTNSLNGVYVNGHHLKPFTPYTLRDGDLIKFGALNCHRPEFLFRFHASCHHSRVIGNNDRKIGSLKRMASETLIDGTADNFHATHEHTDVWTTIFNFAEKKLQCGVCGRLLVQATVLNCSHMFCKLCIFNWMQNNDTCPTCQQFIISVVHVTALDSCLHTIAEQLGQRDKHQRAVVIPLPNAKKTRLCDTVIKHLPSLGMCRNNGLAVSKALVRAAAILESPGVTTVSSERIALTNSEVNTQTSFIEGPTKFERLPACLRKPPAKHSPLAAKIVHQESRKAAAKEKLLNKFKDLKRTSALKQIQRISGGAIKATRGTTDEQAMVTTADAFLTGKPGVEPADGSMTAHCHKVSRNSSKAVISDNESADNITPEKVVVNKNKESDSVAVKNDSVEGSTVKEIVIG